MRKADKARSIGEAVQRDAEKKEADVNRMKKELADVQQAFQRAQGERVAATKRSDAYRCAKKRAVGLLSRDRL